MINYLHLANSVEYYKNFSYKEIEVPWWVGVDISLITKTNNNKDYFISENQKVLVASAEQSFISLMNQGQLEEGLYQAITPCFRNEALDDLHQKYFMKNELINTINVKQRELDKMIEQALSFFSQYLPKEKLKIVKVDIEKTQINYDIVCSLSNREIELGSYGIRSFSTFEWIYGTACAEPRLSYVMTLNKQEEKNNAKA